MSQLFSQLESNAGNTYIRKSLKHMDKIANVTVRIQSSENKFLVL